MRKKLLAVVSLVIILAMESATVFATETGESSSPTSQAVQDYLFGDAAQNYLYGDVTTGKTISGDVVMLNGETDNALRLYRLRLNSEVITESNDVIIGMIEAGDSGLNGLDDTSYNLSREKLMELAEQAKLDGLDMDGIAFDVTSSEQDITITFLDDRIEEADNYSGRVKVYHLLPGGEWEEPTFVCQDGTVTVHFQNGFSPVMIVKYIKPETTISGATSPKTSEADPYRIVASLVVLALAGTVICSRKLINK